VERCAISPTQTRTWREALLILDLENFGTPYAACHSATCFFSYRMASLTGRLVGATPVGEVDVIVESQEYDKYAKSIRGKAV
jgi:hypothetical protein